MKYQILKNYFLILLIGVLTFAVTNNSFGQRKRRVFFYSKVMPGYGNIFDKFEVTTPGQYGPVTANHRMSHGNGLNLDLSIGGSISRSKNVSKYSHLDIFVQHRQLFASEAFFMFSGGGIQVRNRLAHANVVFGYSSVSDEIPNRRDEQRVIGYGEIQPFAYGFGAGINLPWEPRSKLIFIWDANFLFPRSQYDDLTGFLNYTWFSTALGVKYYLSRIK